MVMTAMRLASLSSLVCCQEKTELRGIALPAMRVFSNVKVSTLTSHQILSPIESFFTVMAEVIEADLSSHTINTQSWRRSNEVLNGENVVIPLINACSGEDVTKLRTILEHPPAIALESPHHIYQTMKTMCEAYRQ